MALQPPPPPPPSSRCQRWHSCLTTSTPARLWSPRRTCGQSACTTRGAMQAEGRRESTAGPACILPRQRQKCPPLPTSCEISNANVRPTTTCLRTAGEAGRGSKCARHSEGAQQWQRVAPPPCCPSSAVPHRPALPCRLPAPGPSVALVQCLLDHLGALLHVRRALPSLAGRVGARLLAGSNARPLPPNTASLARMLTSASCMRLSA